MVAPTKTGDLTMKKFLTVALAAAALSLGSLAVTGEASAKGFKGGMHGHGHHHGHRHWGHWRGGYGHYGYGYSPCYWVFKPYYGKVKVCASIY
jgi:hypothetical protein